MEVLTSAVFDPNSLYKTFIVNNKVGSTSRIVGTPGIFVANPTSAGTGFFMFSSMKSWMGLVIVLAGLATSQTGWAGIVNGGSDWTGWTKQGTSTDIPGIASPTLGYARGTTDDVYDVYTTEFIFNNHAKDSGVAGGGPTGGTSGFGTGGLTTGAFANGNRILGIGIDWISGSKLFTNGAGVVRFDLDGDAYRTASSLGGTDGRGSFSGFSEYRDFTVQFDVANTTASLFSVQANSARILSNSNGTGTTSATSNEFALSRNSLSGNQQNDWPFRIFRPSTGAETDNYQMFFDLDAMQAQFGISTDGNPPAGGLNKQGTGGSSLPWSGIGSIGGATSFSLRGFGGNDVAYGATLQSGGGGGVVPEPTSIAIFGLGALGMAYRARRKSKA